jgi:hypothetical protein
MNNKLEYEPADKRLNDFIPASTQVPDWYKKIPPFYGKEKKMLIKDFNINSTVKQCLPFLEAMTAGYFITLWTDVQVTIIDGQPILTWLASPDPVNFRNRLVDSSDLVPEGFSPAQFVWENPYYIRTPKKYSILLTHPFNRHDLPFHTTTGIADCEKTLHKGSIPFFVKKDFEGIIKAGTPIAQIIPFRKENWNSQLTQGLVEIGEKNNYEARRTFNHWYKKNAWNKVEYN